jgi:hypothetical protein
MGVALEEHLFVLLHERFELLGVALEIGRQCIEALEALKDVTLQRDWLLLTLHVLRCSRRVGGHWLLLLLVHHGGWLVDDYLSG